MRILVDIDGVLADFTKSFTSLAKDMGLVEASWSCNEQEKWDFDFDSSSVWNRLKDSWNWWMTLPPVVDNQEIQLLNRAVEENDIYFVTNRPRTKGFSAETQSRLWLGSIGVHADHASVIATRSGTKGALARALDIKVAIDDKPENLEEMHQEGIRVIKREWPYNKDYKCRTVTSLKQFLTPSMLDLHDFLAGDMTPDGRFYS